MKKKYVTPVLKSLDINEEQLLISISVDGGTNNDDILGLGGDGNADDEGLGKSSVWD